jgi:ferritin
MQAAINSQINAELYSSYLYLAMAAYLEDISLSGAANWMKIQAQEELLHATKFFDYVHERDGRVVLKAIGEPPREWDSILDVFESAYAHEQKVTALINDLATIAEQERDRASMSFLQWFIDEQVEEEASAKTIADHLRMVQGAPHAVFMIDRELGQRVFTPPAAAPAD